MFNWTRSTSRRNRGTSQDATRKLRLEQLEGRLVLSGSGAGGPVEIVAPVVTSGPAVASNPPPENILQMTYQQFVHLSPEDIRHVSAPQIATIPNDWWMNMMAPETRAQLDVLQVRALNVAEVGLRRLTARQMGFLTPEQIRSVDFNEFRYLGPNEIIRLTPQQVSTIPHHGWFGDISAEARGALLVAQIRALDAAEIGLWLLTPEQREFLTPAQIRTLDYELFEYLSPTTVIHLTPEQLGTIPHEDWFDDMTAETRAALTPNQVQGLNVANVGVRRLTVEQRGFLTAEQLHSLSFDHFRYLGPNELSQLTPAQMSTIPHHGWFGDIPAESRAALTIPQIQALNAAEIGLWLLTPQQRDFLAPAQVRTLDFELFEYLSPTTVIHLTPEQLGTIPHEDWFDDMSDETRAALTATQVRGLNVANVGVRRLTVQQRTYLSAEQLHTLTLDHFRFLGPNELSQLTPAQVSTIPHHGWFGDIPAESRAALTLPQVQALQAASVGIWLLTPQQREWLSVSQIQSLDFELFEYLSPTTVVHLTPAQVATIPHEDWFDDMTVETRAALTQIQIQALNVATIGLRKLTDEQINFLTPAQIHTIDFQQFQYLSPQQIVHLTLGQAATIPNDFFFNQIPRESREALTAPQIQALTYNDLFLTRFTSSQRDFLLPSQVAKLNQSEWDLLSPQQVPHLTATQLANVTGVGFLSEMSEEARAAFTRAQLLALPNQFAGEIGGLVASRAAPEDYVSVFSIPPDADGLAGDARTINERNAIFALVPHSAATHTTAQSGDWLDPNTWQEGVVPDEGADVVIAAGHTVRFDAVMSETVRTIRVDGTLTFAADQHTLMRVDTIIVHTNGALHIGTEAQPIQAGVQAEIIFAAGPIDTAWDPALISRGISGRGQIRMVGQEVTPFAPLAVTPSKGATQLVLEQVPTNWQVGDRLVITGTDEFNNQDEERNILAIAGNTVTVAPLSFSHHTPAGHADLSAYVANTTRNIRLTSANPNVIAERGHLMFAHNKDVRIINVELRNLGRTNKSLPINDPVIVNGVLTPGTGLNRRARYSLHFHRTSIDQSTPPAIVKGSVVANDPGWGFVNHSSHVVFEDNVAYNVTGSAFATEDGNEVGAMRRNLAIRTSGSGEFGVGRPNHDWGHAGHGFWLQGPGVEMVDNISAGNGHASFAMILASTKNLFEAVNLDDPSLAAGHDAIPVESVPLAQFSGNVAFAATRGLEIWYHNLNMPDGHAVIDDFTSWGMRIGGIWAPYSGQLTIRNSKLLGNLDNPTGTAIQGNEFTHDMRYENLWIEGYSVGINAPARRDNVIQDGHFATVTAIKVQSTHDSQRSLQILGFPLQPTLTAAQLAGREQVVIDFASPLDIGSFDLAEFYSPSAAQLGDVQWNGAQFYHLIQHPDIVPFPSTIVPATIPSQLHDLTNAEIFDLYGIAPGGRLAPDNVVTTSGTDGILAMPTDPVPNPFLGSERSTSDLAGYVLRYRDAAGRLYIDPPTNLQAGWNLLTRVVDGNPFTFLIFGDAPDPSSSAAIPTPPAPAAPAEDDNGSGYVSVDGDGHVVGNKPDENLLTETLTVDSSSDLGVVSRFGIDIVALRPAGDADAKVDDWVFELPASSLNGQFVWHVTISPAP